MTLKYGTKVIVQLRGEVQVSDDHEPLVHFGGVTWGVTADQESSGAALWIPIALVVAEKPDDDDWRTVCADMIRLGADLEAVALLVEKAPTAVPYICRLEALWSAFSRLPTLDAYEHMVARAGIGRIEMREKIADYARALEAWAAVRDDRDDAKVMADREKRVVERVIMRLLESIDSSEAWGIARRDPEALKGAVRLALKEVTK